MDTVFVDTGYLLALELAGDINHPAALVHRQTVLPTLTSLLTTTYVFDEMVTFFNNRGFHTRAAQVGNNLLHSSLIELVHVDEMLFYEGWTYFQKHQDKSYSLTDCISFVVMGQRGITTALTFDHHFTQAGFQRQPM